jgi:hypothetical protein
MKKAKDQRESYSEQETARRRDAVIKLMLSTPPKPHSEMKLGKPRAKPKKSPGRAAKKKSGLAQR